jgi:urease accessory protein
VLRLCPGGNGDPRSIGLLGGRDVIATLYVVAHREDPNELVQVLREALAGGETLAGVSELPNGCGESARLLGATSKAVRVALRDASNAVRLTLLGAPAPDLRKG